MATHTYNNILKAGLQSDYDNLGTKDPDSLYFCTDTGKLYKGNVDFTRPDIILDYTEAQIKALASPEPKLYRASDTGHYFIYINSTYGWYDITGIKLTTDSANHNQVIWFSSSTDMAPYYNSNFTYNPSTGTFTTTNVVATTVKVGNMLMSQTVVGTDKTIEFNFVQ